MPSSPLHALRLSELVAGLGTGLASVVPSESSTEGPATDRQGAAPTDPLIDDVTLAEPGAGLTGVPGDLLIGVGVTLESDALALVEAAAAAGAGALALRRHVTRHQGVRDAVTAAGLPLVAVADEASWAHIAWLVRELLDRALAGTRAEESLGPDELFALADACAALVGGPVTIEDTSSRVLAYSESSDRVDPARLSTIVGRRVPAATVAALRARGVFRHLVRSAEPLYLPPASDGSLGARLIVPVRVGDEWIGSIWAIVDGPVPEAILRPLREVAAVVALHLLRLRTASDLGRRWAGERLRSALAGDVGAVGEVGLPAPPWRVVILGADPAASPAARLAHWESVCRRAAWQRPHLVAIDDDVIAVVADRPEVRRAARDPARPDRQSWGWLAKLVSDVAGQRPWAWAAASPPVASVEDLPTALSAARDVARLLPDGTATGPTVSAEAAWAPLVVARAVTAVARESTGIGSPLDGLPGDGARESMLAETLRVWLDHPGDLKACAVALGVHVNTVRHRLSRVRAELGVDLHDPTVRLALTLQLRALHARGPSRG